MNQHVGKKLIITLAVIIALTTHQPVCWVALIVACALLTIMAIQTQ